MRLLSPCPDKPNCISTASAEECHASAPLLYRNSRGEAKESLKTVIVGLPRTKLVEEDDAYLPFEFTSLLLRFADDVELVVDEASKTIIFVRLPVSGMAIWARTFAGWKKSVRCWMVSSDIRVLCSSVPQGGFV